MKIKNLYGVAICFVLAFGISITASAQLNQRFDNIKYKAIYLDDASKLIKQTPGLLLLDVRTPGEYADTSSNIVYNIGRLKDARNVPIDSVAKHLAELKKYKNQPILVYCSHSVRSRRVSKLLTDSGFTKVYSLNGGMSLVNKSTDKEFPVKRELYRSHIPYKLIESADAEQFILQNKGAVIDVRPASQFYGKDANEENNIGRIKTAVNIPIDGFDAKFPAVAKYKSRPVLIYDEYGPDADVAAQKLTKAGFKKVYVLFEGITTFLPNTPANAKLRSQLFAGLPKYKAIGSKEFIALAKQKPGLLIADIRSKAEFENKGTESYERLGHVVNAVNYTPAQLISALQGKPKATPILIYSANMTGMQHGESGATLSKTLAQQGFTNVYLLYNGLYSLVWSVTNVADSRNGADILTDHKGLY